MVLAARIATTLLPLVVDKYQTFQKVQDACANLKVTVSKCSDLLANTEERVREQVPKEVRLSSS